MSITLHFQGSRTTTSELWDFDKCTSNNRSGNSKDSNDKIIAVAQVNRAVPKLSTSLLLDVCMQKLARFSNKLITICASSKHAIED